jgi:hypothetical protein
VDRQPGTKWFEPEFRKFGKKLDMGKCCVRFKKLDDFTSRYERSRAGAKRR